MKLYREMAKRHLYHLDLPVSDALRRILPVEQGRSGHHRAKHRYGVEDHGLSEEGIYEALEDLYAIYGWPVPEAAQSQVA